MPHELDWLMGSLARALARELAPLVLEELRASAPSVEVDPWMTPEEAAGYLGLSIQTIRKLAREQRITSALAGEHKLRFRQSWLDDFVEATKVPAVRPEFHALSKVS